MSDAVPDFSPSDLIDVIEGNLVDSSAALGRSEDGVVYLGSDVSWVYTGRAEASRVLRARFTPDDVQDRVAQIHGFFKDWEAPVSWVVGPGSYPPKLGDYLSAVGFGAGDPWIGMAMDLNSMQVGSAKSEFQIREALTEADRSAWESIQPDKDEERSFISTDGDARCRYFFARVNGVPIARCMTCRRDTIVGLYSVTTSADSARRRASAALVQHVLGEAGEGGAKMAVMAVSLAHQSFAETLGFKGYCQFSVYTWPAGKSHPAVPLHA